MSKSILLASQRQMISQGISLRLTQEPDLRIVGWAESPSDLQALYAKYVPDVVLICMRLFGVQTARHIRAFLANECEAKFLAISSTIDRHLIVEVMESGAKGFLSPTHGGFEELLSAVNAIANGRTYVCQEAAECLLGGLFSRTHQVQPEPLSEREKQVVRLVCDGNSSKEIARILTISPSTVEVHRRNIMRKVGVHKTADLTRYAIRTQLVTL